MHFIKTATLMKILYYLLSITLLLACKKQQKTKKLDYSIEKAAISGKTGYTITGKALGYEDGTKIYINGTDQNSTKEFFESKIVLDSTTINNENFKITMPYFEPNDFHYLTFENSANHIFYIIENRPIVMVTYKDSLGVAKIKGGPQNNAYSTYNAKMINFSKRLNLVNQKFTIAEQQGNVKAQKKIHKNKNAIRSKEKKYLTNFVKKHPNSPVSLLVLSRSMSSKKLKDSEIKKLLGTLNQSLQNSRIGRRLEHLVGLSMDIGDHANNFNAPTPDDTTLSLEDAMGKITIIDFWASWCAPCRAENPNVVKIYNKYHDKGLNIIGISLDKSKEKWIKAIVDDELPWYHVSNLRFWEEPIAKAYGVKGIPATFIIDEQGVIIAKNLKGKALENKIEALLEPTS